MTGLSRRIASHAYDVELILFMILTIHTQVNIILVFWLYHGREEQV